MFFKLAAPRLYGKVIGNALRRGMKARVPASAILGMTYDCQCQCVHCSAGLYKNQVSRELSGQEWKELFDLIHRMGVPRVNLTGGEALLRKDIYDMVAYAARFFVVILESNGLRVSREVARRLKEACVSCVAISIDSTSGHEHDGLRKSEGCFDQALEGIRNLHQEGVPCIMSTYIPAERARADYVQGLMMLARRMKVTAVRILPPRPVGSFSCHVSSLLRRKDEILIRNCSDPFISYFNGIPSPRTCGIFSKATFYVSPCGDIQPCPFMPLSFGNVKDTRLDVLLERMWDHAVFQNEGKECLVLSAAFRKKHLEGRGTYPVEVGASLPGKSV